MREDINDYNHTLCALCPRQQALLTTFMFSPLVEFAPLPRPHALYYFKNHHLLAIGIDYRLACPGINTQLRH